MTDEFEPDWSLHEPILSAFFRTPRPQTEGEGTQYANEMAEVDHELRRWLEYHDIVELVTENPVAGYVALTVAEGVASLFANHMAWAVNHADDAEHVGLHAHIYRQSALPLFAWIGAHHAPNYKYRVPAQPFGVHVPIDELPDADYVKEKP